MSVDIHALSGAYAVDAVDEFERAQFERHLADCDTCQAEVDSLRAAASLIGETAAATPPDSLRDSVLAGIKTVRPLPPVVVAVAERGRSTRRRFPTMVAAAAAVIAVGAIGYTAVDVVRGDDPSIEARLSDSEQVLQASDREVHEQTFDDGSTATLVRSKSLNRAVIVTRDMAPPPSLHAYELWFERDGEMIPAGQMGGGSNTIVLDGDASRADGVGITVELAGEPPTEPSDKLVTRIDFKRA